MIDCSTAKIASSGMRGTRLRFRQAMIQAVVDRERAARSCLRLLSSCESSAA